MKNKIEIIDGDKEKQERIEIGQFYLHNNGAIYHLCITRGDGHVALSNLATGCIWTISVRVSDTRDITQQEWTRITNSSACEFSRIINEFRIIPGR